MTDREIEINTSVISIINTAMAHNQHLKEADTATLCESVKALYSTLRSVIEAAEPQQQAD